MPDCRASPCCEAPRHTGPRQAPQPELRHFFPFGVVAKILNKEGPCRSALVTFSYLSGSSKRSKTIQSKLLLQRCRNSKSTVCFYNTVRGSNCATDRKKPKTNQPNQNQPKNLKPQHSTQNENTTKPDKPCYAPQMHLRN